MNLNSWKNHWFSGVFAEEIQKGIDCFKTLISLFKQKSLGGVMRSLWDLIKTILSFRYFDIILLLILFFKLQEAESYRIARLGELVFEWEQKLPQAAFSDYCILCIPLLFLPRFWRNLYHVVIFCCLLAITIHILLLKTYGQGFDQFTVVLLKNTTFIESILYLKTLTGYQIMFLCGGLLGFLAVLFACRFQKRTFCWLDLVVALLLMMPLLSFAVREKNHECYPDILVSRTSGLLALGNGWLEYHKTIEKDQMIVDHPVFPKGLQRSPKSDDLLGVILIGESATRGRFSLYGCSRETCPKMKRNMDQMILFSSAVSQFAHTNMAFKSIFAVSAQPDMPPEACFDAVLNQAGYQTEYLSSVWERARGWNAWSYATRQLFSSTKMTSVADTHEIPFYDEELLPFLKDMIDRSASAPKIIFVNWSGSHFPPEHHVPESRRVFSKGLQADFDRDDYQQTILAYYDDSILYDDDLLFRITEMLNASARPAFLLYFSDHGQNFTDDQHGKWVPRDRTVAQCYEIPLFLWFNRKYAERFPALQKNGQMNRDREFCSNTLYWSMLSLCGISYQDFPYRMDLFSDQFLPQKDLPAWKQYLKMKENKTK